MPWRMVNEGGGMRGGDRLEEFLRAGLAAGYPPERLAAALRAAGWSERRIEAGLAEWHVEPGLPPVPRSGSGQAGAGPALLLGLGFLALVAMCWQLVQLGFHLAEHATPGLAPDWYGASRMRWPIAVLVVMIPVFAVLHLRRDASGWPRRWLAAFSGFLAGVALLGSAVAVVHALLAGDLTARFALKAAVVVVVSLLALLVYRRELGAGGTGAEMGPRGLIGLALAMVVAGIWVSGGPGAGRAEQRDQERWADLDVIAGQAMCLAGEGVAVPPVVATEGCPELPNLADRQTGAPYRIALVRPGLLRLCAEMESEAMAGRLSPAGPGCREVALPEETRRGPGLMPPGGGILAPDAGPGAIPQP